MQSNHKRYRRNRLLDSPLALGGVLAVSICDLPQMFWPRSEGVMTIYVDPIRKVQRVHGSTQWCHMASDDSTQELHEFAARIGLKRAWFQAHPWVPHYDLTPSKRKLAVLHGATEVESAQELARLCRKG